METINYLDILVGQIPEAIFFSLFMIYGKNIKEKRILFTMLMILQYIIIANILPYNIWFQILYTFNTYFILKKLYGDKTQITDLFLFTSASIILILSSLIFIPLNVWVANIYIICLLSKVFVYSLLYLGKNILYNYYCKFQKYWCRSTNDGTIIKILTLKNISVVIFNITFVIINFALLYLIRR